MTYCIQSRRILITMRDCILVNGTLLATIWAVSRIVYLLPINHSGMLAEVWGALFSVLWVMPVYLGSFLLGITWYRDLYRTASALKHRSLGVAELPSPVAPSLTSSTDTFLKIFVTLAYSFFALFIGVVPYVGPPVSFVLSSWLHAWYCFEYRLADQRQYDPSRGARTEMRLMAQVSFFEKRWAYFFGFGATHLAFRVFLLDMHLELTLYPALAICSTLYALNVVMSVDARPSLAPPTFAKIPFFSFGYNVVLSKLSSSLRRANTVESEAVRVVRDPESDSSSSD